jgi:hypothetical protein
MIQENIINVLVLVAFAISFITIFFFTYVKEIEKQIVINNVNYLINNLIPHTNLLNQDIKKKIIDEIDKIQLPDLANEDKEVKARNKTLINKSILIITIICIIVFFISYFMCTKYNIDLSNVIIRNILLVIGIGMTEFVFLHLAIKRYISADPNVVKHELINKILI